jgi:hypothetical protein
MTALNTSHFLLLIARDEKQGIFQVLTRITDPDIAHTQQPPEVNYFLDRVSAEAYKKIREECRFYACEIVEWSAQAVQDAYS